MATRDAGGGSEGDAGSGAGGDQRAFALQAFGQIFTGRFLQIEQADGYRAAAVSPAVQLVMQVNSASLAPYDNYQIQFAPTLGTTWENWNGGLFRPTDVTNTQFLFVTNSTGFYRLVYVSRGTQ